MTTTIEIIPEALAAAIWWRKKIDSNFISDNGEPMHGMMAAMIPKKQLTVEQLDTFEADLAERFSTTWTGSEHGIMAGQVDYGPSRDLSEAYEKATGERSGMETFPWKTWVRIKLGMMVVRCGYGADYENINVAEYLAANSHTRKGAH